MGKSNIKNMCNLKDGKIHLNYFFFAISSSFDGLSLKLKLACNLLCVCVITARKIIIIIKIINPLFHPKHVMCHKMPQDINLYGYDLISLTSSEHFKHAKHCIYFSTDTSVMCYICNVRRQQEKNIQIIQRAEKRTIFSVMLHN